MPYVTYENHTNKHITIHSADCRQIAKRGGTHKNGQGSYHQYETLADADAYAETTSLPIIHCSFCNPQVLTAVTRYRKDV